MLSTPAVRGRIEEASEAVKVNRAGGSFECARASRNMNLSPPKQATRLGAVLKLKVVMPMLAGVGMSPMGHSRSVSVIYCLCNPRTAPPN